MDWATTRERLGAELIGAREAVALRWRELLGAQGLVPRGLEAAASEMVLQAGAALADGSVPETPWIRCGGVLRIDARASGEQLAIELAVLWDALEGQLVRIAFSDDEEREARGLLALQLAAALRGADAETREALFDLPIFDRSLRFGGVKLVTYPPNTAAAATRAA